ncbi:CASP-like protein 1B1 [Malania oleifera]|uniref:CASP-like protein 1B1 n=1 Tax=Malania oleifera TaxID=397392 RepID=UPI0025AE9563|nr:CASP-like protein 1B1 [Malania oleifera]
MAEAGGEKQEVERKRSVAVLKNSMVLIVLLRLLAFLATATATVVMALNKETKTFVVATVGNSPITATITAKFQDTPANVYFVIANGMASFHNLLMLGVHFYGYKLDYRGIRFVAIAILDMTTVALISGGTSAAAFMAEVGKNGNSHARWDKICDKFESFCNRASGALLASFIGTALLITITVISIITVHKQKSSSVNYLAVP